MKMRKQILALFIFTLLWPFAVGGQDFTKSEAQIAKFKKSLDLARSERYRYWVRIDSSRRPHRLYLGVGFYKADHRTREDFVETFSQYLAGYPGKFALIDLYDGATGKHIGEFGWGGYKLYDNARSISSRKLAERKED